MDKRKAIIVTTALVVVAGSFGLMEYFGTMGEPPVERVEPEVKKFVKTVKVGYGTVPTEITAYGRVKAAESLDLIAEKSGRMTERAVRLKEGISFRKGELLFKIDDTEAKLNLQSQKSNFLRDLAAILPDLKIDYEDNYDAWYTYFKSIDIDKPLPKLPAHKSTQEKTFLATKNIFSGYYNIKSTEETLSKYKFYAPFGGTIAEVTLQNGSFVNPGNKIARIIRTDKLELKVDVETTDVSWIKKGVDARVETEDGTQSWDGRVSRISEYVNPNTQSIDVYVSLHPGDHDIYDGLFLKTMIPGKRIDNAMEINRSAVFNGNKVYIVQDSLLKVKEIKIHKVNSESIVFTGLNEGENLVVEPLINAFNNMRVFMYPEEQDKINIEQEEPTASL